MIYRENVIEKRTLLRIAILSGLVLLPFLGCAASKVSLKNVAPELTLNKEQFTYDRYKDGINLLDDILRDYKKGKKYDLTLERNYIGIPNSLLSLKGYGLRAQRDIICLKLENAKLRNESHEVIADLERQFQTASTQMETFLLKNSWVD